MHQRVLNGKVVRVVEYGDLTTGRGSGSRSRGGILIGHRGVLCNSSHDAGVEEGRCVEKATWEQTGCRSEKRQGGLDLESAPAERESETECWSLDQVREDLLQAVVLRGDGVVSRRGRPAEKF